ncbi:TlpA family protein disulfide reductase [Nitratifractor sp.]
MKKLIMSLLLGSFLTLSLHATEDVLTLPTITGKQLHFKGTENGLEVEEYKGKVVFLEFWGTHCPPCLISIPNYIKLQSKYKDKLAIVAVEVQDTPKEQLKKFVEAKGINYDIISYREGLPLVDYITRRAQWQGNIPFLLILDKQGNVVTMQVGLLNEKALDGIVQELSKLPAKKALETTPSK